MVWIFFIPLIPYLLWLVWAALRYPVPLSYNWRSLWQRKVSTLSTASAIAVVVAIFVVVLSLSQGLSKAFVNSGRPDQALVIRPTVDLRIGRTEGSVAKLDQLYELGRRDGALQLKDQRFGR